MLRVRVLQVKRLAPIGSSGSGLWPATWWPSPDRRQSGPEREPSRAWPEASKMLWPCGGSAGAELPGRGKGRGQRILEPLTAPVEG